jgi:hypothetical protein
MLCYHYIQEVSARSPHPMLSGYGLAQDDIGASEFSYVSHPSSLRAFSYGLNSILLLARGNRLSRRFSLFNHPCQHVSDYRMM